MKWKNKVKGHSLGCPPNTCAWGLGLVSPDAGTLLLSAELKRFDSGSSYFFPCNWSVPETVLLLAFPSHAVKRFSPKIKKKRKKKKKKKKKKNKIKKKKKEKKKKKKKFRSSKPSCPQGRRTSHGFTAAGRLEDALAHQLVLRGAPGLPSRSRLIAN